MPRELSNIHKLLLLDYRLTTANILYFFPDHPSLIQSYLWQDLDLSPKFPVLQHFLDFWESELEGKLHSVEVQSCDSLSITEYQHAVAELHIE